MVENTEGAIKNVQSWDTGNIGRNQQQQNARTMEN